ncbi:MAG: hypothetical protein N3C60_07495 [Calditerrivibrio sp.]|nr:hypothetical protein [Calditerrivibrio sp.]
MERYKSLIESLNLKYDPSVDGITYVAKFHYKGNRGFFHIFCDTFNILLIKSIHKDFVRVLSGVVDLDDRILSRISDFLSNIERNHSFDLMVEFSIFGDDFIIKGLKDDLATKDMIPFGEIKSPLTGVEYSLFKDSSIEKNLYSNTIFSGFFPDTLTYFTSSLLKKHSEIFSPLFVHANFKTYTPSIKIIFNKPYFNMRNASIWGATLNVGDYFYDINFAQHLFVKKDYKKIPKLDSYELNITFDEIKSILDEIREYLVSFDDEKIFSEHYTQLLSLIVMCEEMNFLLLMGRLCFLLDTFRDLDNTLMFIYKTRRHNPLSNSKIKVCEYFDLNTEVRFVEIPSFEPVDVEDFLKEISSIKRVFYKKKILEAVEHLHNGLDVRDELFVIRNNLMIKTKEIVDKIASRLMENMQIKKKDDIYYLELDEIKQILDNNFYGNVAFNIYFRKAQMDRFKIQFVPPEIYEGDIDRVEEIADNLVKRLFALNTHKTVTFFYKDDVKNYKILPSSSISYVDEIISFDGVIVNNVPLFSHFMEFCALQGKAIWSGIRIPDKVFSGRDLILKKGEIIVK